MSANDATGATIDGADTPDARAARAQLLALCARLLAEEVDAPLLRALADPRMREAMAPLDVAFIAGELLAQGEARALEELAAEYCHLFVLPGAPCTPYQSAFTGAAMLGARHADRVEEVAALHGLAITRPARVATSDHIAVQLALLAAALGRGRAGELAVADVLEQLLLPWAPAYFEALAGAARLPTWRAVARLAPALLHAELAPPARASLAV